ncbi:hypothetical protein FKM82_018562 [Ascaphus truei]
MLKILESGIGGRTYDTIKSMFSENKCCVKLNNKRTGFHQGCGVRQGCSLSPTLFNIYINELAAALESSAPGLNLAETEIKSLRRRPAPAVSNRTRPPTETDNTRKIQPDLGTLNLEKTRIMVFQKKSKKHPPISQFTLDDNALEQTASCTYLGLKISSSGKCNLVINTLKEKARRAFYAIRKQMYHPKPPIRIWMKIFNSIITPILLYGREVWGPVTYPDSTKGDTSPTEVLHLEF